jgi:hypothetical protein
MSTETAVAPDAAPVADTAPWYSAAYDPASPGKLSDDWLSKAPEDVRKDWEPYAKEKDPFEIAVKEQGRRKEAQTALRNKVAAANNLPPKPEGDAATPEAMAEYYKARNLPVDPKEYGLAKPADMPDALWNQSEADAAAKLFHDLELSPDTVKALTAWHQGNARQSLAAHNAAMEAQRVALAEEKRLYIQSEKEALVRDFGVSVDPAINKIKKLCEASGLDPESFNPDIPEKWIGAGMVRTLASLVKMIPGTGDFTRAQMGGKPNGSTAQDANYFRSLTKGDPDWEALQSSSHPRNKEVYAARAEAYRIEAELRDAK